MTLLELKNKLNRYSLVVLHNMEPLTKELKELAQAFPALAALSVEIRRHKFKEPTKVYPTKLREWTIERDRLETEFARLLIEALNKLKLKPVTNVEAKPAKKSKQK